MGILAWERNAEDLMSSRTRSVMAWQHDDIVECALEVCKSSGLLFAHPFMAATSFVTSRRCCIITSAPGSMPIHGCSMLMIYVEQELWAVNFIWMLS
jgi:hypothetical protein